MEVVGQQPVDPAVDKAALLMLRRPEGLLSLLTEVVARRAAM